MGAFRCRPRARRAAPERIGDASQQVKAVAGYGLQRSRPAVRFAGSLPASAAWRASLQAPSHLRIARRVERPVHWR